MELPDAWYLRIHHILGNKIVVKRDVCERDAS